jgi:hypothetical protein
LGLLDCKVVEVVEVRDLLVGAPDGQLGGAERNAQLGGTVCVL